MTELEELISLLNKKEKLVAMLAPSFPIMFDYPGIITRLKKLGFSYVMEVSLGAMKTNQELVDLLKKNPEARYITTPCPTIVRMVKKQMPEYAKYFTHGVDSPMVATAKIAHEHFPGYRPVFIGPCLVKKMEAKEDVPELGIVVVTYNEMLSVFEKFGIGVEINSTDKFDLAGPGDTRLYPVDGGLAHSSGVLNNFGEEAVKIVSGWKNCLQAIRDFDKDTKVRLLDILFCDGGCIGGPGIKSSLDTQQRKQKILDYRNQNFIS